jgi:hypothetical protein
MTKQPSCRREARCAMKHQGPSRTEADRRGDATDDGDCDALAADREARYFADANEREHDGAGSPPATRSKAEQEGQGPQQVKLLLRRE